MGRKCVCACVCVCVCVCQVRETCSCLCDVFEEYAVFFFVVLMNVLGCCNVLECSWRKVKVQGEMTWGDFPPTPSTDSSAWS